MSKDILSSKSANKGLWDSLKGSKPGKGKKRKRGRKGKGRGREKMGETIKSNSSFAQFR